MTIRYEVKGKVAEFTIDNPPVNITTPSMHKEFYDCLLQFLADRNVSVGILTGVGDRAFCGGDDIKNYHGHGTTQADLEAHFWPSTEQNIMQRPGWERELNALERDKPIIAAVNGPAMGMGLMYLLNQADLRIAVPQARFGFPEVAYGMGGAGGLASVGKHLPRSVALWMLLTGEPLSAEGAIKYDLINEIVEPSRLMERAHEIAGMIVRHPPLAIKVEMESFNKSMELPRREAIAYATHLYRLQRATYLGDPDNELSPLGDKNS